MRINLTKKDLVNLIYMQIGYPKLVAENLINDYFSLIISSLQKEKKIKISKFGTFTIREKKSRIGRNPKTKEEKNISKRNVVLFKASKEFKLLINQIKDDEKKLREKIKKFRQDEIDHKDIAYEEGATKKGLYSLMDKVIKTGSRIAINISEKI